MINKRVEKKAHGKQMRKKNSSHAWHASAKPKTPFQCSIPQNCPLGKNEDLSVTYYEPILLVQRLTGWYFSALAASASRFRTTCSGSTPWVTLYSVTAFYALPGSGLFVKKSEFYRCAKSIHYILRYNMAQQPEIPLRFAQTKEEKMVMSTKFLDAAVETAKPTLLNLENRAGLDHHQYQFFQSISTLLHLDNYQELDYDQCEFFASIKRK